MVQTILGHKHIDTTLQYARLYDRTVARDYFAAMGKVEKIFSPLGKQEKQPSQTSGVLAVLDEVMAEGLSAEQAEIVSVVRERVLGLVESN